MHIVLHNLRLFFSLQLLLLKESICFLCNWLSVDLVLALEGFYSLLRAVIWISIQHLIVKDISGERIEVDHVRLVSPNFLVSREQQTLRCPLHLLQNNVA